MKKRIRHGKIDVFRRLGLRAAEVIPHGAGKVAHLGQNPEFPVRYVIQENPGRQDIVGHVAAAFGEHDVHCLDQRRRRGITGDDFVVVFLCVQRGARYGIERGRLMIQKKHHDQAEQDQEGWDAYPQNPRPRGKLHDHSPNIPEGRGFRLTFGQELPGAGRIES
jgi:hypothetical protein